MALFLIKTKIFQKRGTHPPVRPSFSQAAYGRTPRTAVLITMAPALRYVSGFVLPVEGEETEGE